MTNTADEFGISGLSVSLVPVKNISPNPHNLRIHSEDQVRQIVNAIKQFGWTNPVLIDENNVLVAGHGRLMAANVLKINKIPAIYIRSDLSEDQRQILMLADNKIAQNAKWDEDALALSLATMLGDGLDLELAGWSADELIDIQSMSTPISLDEIDNAVKPAPERSRSEPDGTEDWETFRAKLPPETMQVLHDLLHKVPGKPHEQLESLLSCVDVMALEDLARIEADRRRNA
jgi:ParB-like chromosome segregation protein Spo0J